jgi:acetyl esterase/lipase
MLRFLAARLYEVEGRQQRNRREDRMRKVLAATSILLALSSPCAAQARIEKNVIYGTYSGLALLMDVHRPQTPNGYGLVLVPGSGWHAAQTYGARLIKEGGSSLFVSVPRLLQAGYTLFVVNHRAAPRFRYPAALEDVQRAVRFVRFHAADYSINADWIGVVGYSSGAHLALLLGVLDDTPNTEDLDPVNRVSSRVQCVVASAAPTDLEHKASDPNVVSLLGAPLLLPTGQVDPVAAKAYRAASPVNYVSKSSPPLLLIHGDADETVPFQQAELMMAAAQKAGANIRLIRVAGGRHTFAQDLGKHPEWPDVLGETVRWLDQYLRVNAAR